MRSFTFDCPHCQSSLDVPEQLAGHEVFCSQCRKKLTIPQSESRQNGCSPIPAAKPVNTRKD